MGIKVNPAELKRWESAGLIAPPAPKPGRASPPPPTPGVVLHHHEDDGGPDWRLTLTLRGMKLVSRANAREHWTARHARGRAEAAALALAWIAAGLEGWHPPLPLHIILIRVGGKTMDGDNLASAFKAIRDALAGLVGIDDGDDRIRWRCKQRPGPEAMVRLTLAGGPQPK